MKCNMVLLLITFVVTLFIFNVDSHKPWTYYPYYPIPVYPPVPRYTEYGQQNIKPTNICIECINRLANLANIFNIPDFTQFGNQFGNNWNNRATVPPPVKVQTNQPSTVQPPLAFTETSQTIRPPIPRRSTVRPIIVQPDPNSSVRIAKEENNESISTKDRIEAILKTTNAPVTQQSYFTYPGIKNALNHMDYQLADIRGPSFEGLQLFYPVGR